MKMNQSVQRLTKLYQRAQAVIPGGVNSPVRAFRSVGGTPVFMQRACDAYLYDVDDRAFVDFCMSWGAMILGHAFHPVLEEVHEALEDGTSFGCATEKEVELAELVSKIMPSMEQVRFVSSGTEATMSALRLARGATGRNKIVKFEGCYHGHADFLLVKAGSGVHQMASSSSAGVPQGMVEDVIAVPYNDLAQVERVFAEQGQDIAAVIVEPVAANMGVVPPKADFLPGLRALTTKYGALLIFDEVITGFRLSLGGAQQWFGIKPDLTCLGKILGGGFPVGAFGGRRDVMQHLAPVGSVYQAGTLSGNPIAMTAGLATLKELMNANIYASLNQKTGHVVKELERIFKEHDKPVTIQHVGSMFTAFMTRQDALCNVDDVNACDSEMFAKWFHVALDAGVYLSPSQHEANFLSAAHEDADLEKLYQAASNWL